MIRLKATITNISEGMANIYWDEIWKLHGILKKILSERGLQFALKFIEEFTKALVSSSQTVDLVFSLFYFSFLFSVHFIFYFDF